MKLTPYNKKDLYINGYKRTKNIRIIDEFVNSEYDCVKVEGWSHGEAFHHAASLNMTIKRMNKSGIKAVSRKGEVFLVKLNGDE